MSSQVTVEKLSEKVWLVGAPEVRPTKDIDSGTSRPWMVAAELLYINQFIKQNNEFAIAIYDVWQGLLAHEKTAHSISAKDNKLLAKLLTLLGRLTLETENSIPLLRSIRTTIDQILGEEETPPDRLQLDSELEQLDTWIISLLKYAKWDQPT